MAYIKDLNIDVTCFLTHRGKELYLMGDDSDIVVTSFTLGDDDTNYQLTSNLNILTRGFVPALSGEYNQCESGMGNGTTIKNMLNYKPKGKLLNQYCTSDYTLVQTYQTPEGNLVDIRTANSPSCNFKYYSNAISKTYTPNITPYTPVGLSSEDSQFQRYVINDYTVKLPYGFQTSTVSQIDADTKALNYLNNNGQQIANQNGTITYYSSPRVVSGLIKQPTATFPQSYPSVTLKYKDELFNSNSFTTNNTSINNYVLASKQPIVNSLPLVIQEPLGTTQTGYYNQSTSGNNKLNQIAFLLNQPIMDGELTKYDLKLTLSNLLTNGGKNYPIITDIELGDSLYLSSNTTNNRLTSANVSLLNSINDNSIQTFTKNGLKLTQSQLYSPGDIINSSTCTKGTFSGLFQINKYGLLPSGYYDLIVVHFQNSNPRSSTTTFTEQSYRYNLPKTNVTYQVIDTNSNVIKLQ